MCAVRRPGKVLPCPGSRLPLLAVKDSRANGATVIRGNWPATCNGASEGAPPMLVTLAAQIAAFTGQPIVLDARLRPPECSAPPAIFWTGPAHDGVGVTCAAPGWRLFVPVARPAGPAQPVPVAVPLVRRGDRVSVAAGGDGFRVTLDALVEADAGAGARVRLRNRASGEVLQGIVGADGEIVVPGFKGGGGGR